MKIGPYAVEERLGAGGMGEVYRAYDHRLGRRVALKQLRPDLSGTDARSEERRARLRREAWSAAQLSHPNLVQIYDILDDPEGGDGAGEWIVMEYVAGRTLADLVAAGPLPLARIVRLARQVAEGLAAAHGRGVIHRDLKTENVIVAADGTAKILDFGLAKPVGAGDPASWTGTGAVVGTVRAMSPEQARGRRVDFRTDLFSLGTLIYELVSGTSPFLDRGTASTLTRVCGHQPPPLSEVRDGVPEELTRLVDRLLQKIPEARPESAAAVAATLSDIEKTLDPQEASASSSGSERPSAADLQTLFPDGAQGEATPPPSDLWRTETRFSRMVRSRPVMTLGGVLVAILGVILVWLIPQRPSGPGEPVRETPKATFDSAYDALQRGDALLERHDRPGHVDQALDAYGQALEVEPEYPPALSGVARASWRKFLDGRETHWLDRGLAAAERAVELDPQLLRARRSLALVLAERGDYEGAEEEIQRLRRLNPGDAESHWIQGRLRSRQGDLTAAEASFRKAVELAPDDAKFYFDLSVLKQKQGDFDRAEELLHRSLELAPDNAYAYFSLGVMSYFRGEISAAIERFQRSIEIRPSPAAYSNLGTLYFFRGLYDEAVEALEEAVEHGATTHVIRINLGDAYRWAGRPDDAETAYEQALESLRSRMADHPENPDLRSQLALTLAKTGTRDEAVAQLGAMLEHATVWRDLARVLYRRAVAWELCGDRDRALDELSQALAAGYPMGEVDSDPELARLRADPRFETLQAP